MRSMGLLVAAFVLYLTVGVHAGIIQYKDVAVVPGVPYYLRRAMYAASDEPFGYDAPSYISLDLEFELEDADQLGASAHPRGITVAVFHSDQAHLLGYFNAKDGRRSYCCNRALLATGHCVTPYTAIVADAAAINPNFFHHTIDLSGEPGDRPVTFKHRFNVTKSGLHYFYAVNCNSALTTTTAVLLSKSVTFSNPFGYLPGDQYPLLSLFLFLTIAYLSLGILWMILSFVHFKRILRVQYCIGGALGICMVEALSWFHDLDSYNEFGVNSVGSIEIGIVTLTAKRLFFRVLTLLVCLGYGVVKGTLGTIRYKITVLSLVYGIFATCHAILESAQRTHTVSATLVTLIVVPLAICDTIWFYWSVVSLLRTLSSLHQRRQPLKLRTYKSVLSILLTFGCLSAAVVIGGWVTRGMDDTWQWWWVESATWQMMYFLVIAGFAVVLRPRENNVRYEFVDRNEGSGVEMEANEGHQKNQGGQIDQERLLDQPPEGKLE